MKYKRGSVQVVEMTFVLPIVTLVVVSLLYISIALFYYTYAYGLAEEIVEKSATLIGKENKYWQLEEEYISGGHLDELEECIRLQLDQSSILPGVAFDSNVMIDSNSSLPKIVVEVSCTYFGTKVFKISVKREISKPSEFVNNVDFFNAALDLKGFREKIQDQFKDYIKLVKGN